MIRKSSLKLSLFLLLVIFTANSCVPKSKEINLTFDTIEQTDWSGTIHPYDSKDPGFTIISSLDEIECIKELVSESTYIKLNKLNFEENFIIIVFQGEKISSGYSVNITQVIRSDTIINVYALFIEPKPNDAKNDEITSPYQVIKVMKESENWGDEFIFNLVVDEKIIFSLPYYMP